jgi:hypothetical protein
VLERISGTGKPSLSEPVGSLQRLFQGQKWAFKRFKTRFFEHLYIVIVELVWPNPICGGNLATSFGSFPLTFNSPMLPFKLNA